MQIQDDEGSPSSDLETSPPHFQLTQPLISKKPLLTPALEKAAAFPLEAYFWFLFLEISYFLNSKSKFNLNFIFLVLFLFEFYLNLKFRIHIHTTYRQTQTLFSNFP